MRQIDVSNYSVRVRGEEGEWTDLPYEVKDSMIEVLLARDQQLSGPGLLKRNDLARKVMAADGVVLLEETEWDELVTAFSTVKGLGRPDVELVRRVLEAQKIEVETKKDESEV